MKNNITATQIDSLLETFFVEMMEETYEGGLLDLYLKSEDKQSRFSREKVQELFSNVLQYTPFELSWVPSMSNIFRREDITPEERDTKLKDTFNSPYRHMIINKFNEIIGLNLNTFKTNNTYIYEVDNICEDCAPACVVFLGIEDNYLNLGRVYSLKTDSTFDVNLTSLTPFDMDTYSQILKDWKIKYHKSIIKSLCEIA